LKKRTKTNNNFFPVAQLELVIGTRVYPKVSGLSHNEINNNKHSLGSNTKGYGGKTHYTDSQNSNTTAPSGRELYHLQFLLQVASPETFGYTLICFCVSPFNSFLDKRISHL
jgi:hypothetical protein